MERLRFLQRFLPTRTEDLAENSLRTGKGLCIDAGIIPKAIYIRVAINSPNSARSATLHFLKLFLTMWSNSAAL
jgi:hypothetical protein